MVAKLLKYDLKAYFRVLAPVYLTVFAVALFCRIVQFFEPALSTPDTAASVSVYNAIFISSVVLLVLACMVALIITFIQVILVFYRNLFTREGYLSFTLPVSTDQHLCAKLLGAFIATFASLLVTIIAAAIASFGEVLREGVKAGWYLLRMLRADVVEEFGVVHFGGWTVEVILAVLVSFALSTLFYYFCITVGQQAKKNRVLAAFGVSFGIYILLQILATVLVILAGVTDIFDVIENWMDRNAPGSIHAMLLGSTAISAGLAVGAYFICRRLITKRLNLE